MLRKPKLTVLEIEESQAQDRERSPEQTPKQFRTLLLTATPDQLVSIITKECDKIDSRSSFEENKHHIVAILANQKPKVSDKTLIAYFYLMDTISRYTSNPNIRARASIFRKRYGIDV